MESREIHWVGIDVSKKTFDAAVARPGWHYPQTPLRELPAASFERTPEGAGRFVAWLDGQARHGEDGSAPQARVVMESTGAFSVELAAWLVLLRGGLRPAIVNPRHTANYLKSMGARGKTDRLDARALAFYGVERRPAPYEPPTPARAELRELSRLRDDLVAERTAWLNRKGDGAGRVSKAASRLVERRENQLGRDIGRIEREMKALIKRDADLGRDYGLLVSIPGVAMVTACVVLAELGDLRRFDRARQLSAFAGLDVWHNTSGSSVQGRPHMGKAGNGRVRQALYMASMVAVRKEGPMREQYEGRKLQGKPPKVALGAQMRKMLVLMRALLISGKPYDANHPRCGKPCGIHAGIAA